MKATKQVEWQYEAIEATKAYIMLSNLIKNYTKSDLIDMQIAIEECEMHIKEKTTYEIIILCISNKCICVRTNRFLKAYLKDYVPNRIYKLSYSPLFKTITIAQIEIEL